MNTLKALGLIFISCVSVTLLSAQQFNLEFSVVGTGGGVTSIGPDTLILTLGQPLAGESSADSNLNSSGFLYQYSGGPIDAYVGVYSVIDGWNMVSVPRTVSDYSKSAVFPSAVSNAFAYEGSYVIKSTLANGVGYWLKFSNNQQVSMTGYTHTLDTVNVQQGWNMIGSISQSILVTTIPSIPSGIVTSNFFGYQGSYIISSTIEPGKAYWVKVNQNGKLILSSSSSNPSSVPIRIVPTSELPPPPPEREMAEVKEVPKEFALRQNYPNPFNPTTVIHFELPVASHVSLKVYNVLGQEVAMLVDEMQDAGFKSVQWDASHTPSGVYFYRLNAGTFYDVKRMLLLR
ncbi:MAG: T9SS type A sorting domain-containing protein [Ignavibacteria bacterium]|nr:T9SS type A sorting domain-containing protein [Ignavibacteria bacterium]MBI3764892.1 T9SS type A sorting domain-containing protein [Ignavibacteriales bacterium]